MPEFTVVLVASNAIVTQGFCVFGAIIEFGRIVRGIERIAWQAGKPDRSGARDDTGTEQQRYPIEFEKRVPVEVERRRSESCNRVVKELGRAAQKEAAIAAGGTARNPAGVETDHSQSAIDKGLDSGESARAKSDHTRIRSAIVVEYRQRRPCCDDGIVIPRTRHVRQIRTRALHRPTCLRYGGRRGAPGRLRKVVGGPT